MKILKVKDIKVTPDLRESNILERDLFGNPIKFKQSKCTCKIYLKDEEEKEYIWVAKNEHLARAITLIAENEDKKYDIKNKPWLLGRNMFFLSWLYKIYEKYLTKFGFDPPKLDLEKAERFKHANKN